MVGPPWKWPPIGATAQQVYPINLKIYPETLRPKNGIAIFLFDLIRFLFWALDPSFRKILVKFGHFWDFYLKSGKAPLKRGPILILIEMPEPPSKINPSTPSLSNHRHLVWEMVQPLGIRGKFSTMRLYPYMHENAIFTCNLAKFVEIVGFWAELRVMCAVTKDASRWMKTLYYV